LLPFPPRNEDESSISNITTTIMKASLFFPIAFFAVRVLAEVPPACLLSAVNTQDEPSDLAALCGSDAEDVQEAIASLCSDNASAAQSAFISTCSAAGSSVAPYTATGTPSQGTARTTGTSATQTPNASTGASASNTAGGASATGNAAADVKQVGSFAAAAIAIAGVVAVL